jgi:hypothetical protein
VEAENYYEECGFNRIEVPWSVSKEHVEITAPQNATLYPHGDKYLVASGEQSIISLVNSKNLSPGRYMAITPCFRDDADDGLHKPYFVKLELFDNLKPEMSNLLSIIEHCHNFFAYYLPCKSIKVDPEPWDGLAIACSTYDIVSLSGIELGSYGIREHPDVGSWIFATGCAEPRLSTVLEMVNDNP